MTDRDLIPSYWFARTDEEGAGPTYVVGRGDEEITYPCLFRHEAEAIVNALRDRLAQSEMDEAIAAGDGTLHGAIDYWQDRALEAEAKLREKNGGQEV